MTSEERSSLGNVNTDIPEDDEDALAQLSLTPTSSRPENPRAATEPTPAVLLQSWFSEKDRHRPSSGHARSQSPYPHPHWRSKSTGTALSAAPMMARAHSLPNPHSYHPDRSFDAHASTTPTSGSLSPGSLRSSPVRPRSPFKSALDDMQRSASGGAIEAIQEDSELDITPRPISQPSPSLMAPTFSRSNSLRNSRRPASPLHSLANASQHQQPVASAPAQIVDPNGTTNLPSASNSPALGPQRFNEAHPSALHSTSSNSSFSSMPSTPSSARSRSRSPSISSLETIEDAPEQESEAERLAKQLESEGDSDSEDSSSRRRSLDGPRGFGFGRAGRSEKKRWSVCGGERRADLDLETIWED